MGEGYHNFHHQFPMDYRNAFLWYQYDPTKWFIALCGKIGLASHLRVFPSNEISKGQLAMKLKELKQLQDSIKWPTSVDNLPIVTWETCQLFIFLFLKKRPSLSARPVLIVQEESKSRTLILIAGFIHDLSSFLDHHPGGRDHIIRGSGKEMTASFFGGVYTHSNAAHNVSCRLPRSTTHLIRGGVFVIQLLSMMRIGVLDGGVEAVSQPEVSTPSQRLYISEKQDQ